MERLNKFLAHAGVASRRGADELVREGRVTVNGSVVSELGQRVDPAHDAVKVDGKRVAPAAGAPIYLMLNKPRGMVTTLSDPEGRPTVRDLLRGIHRRVYPVGRLDFNTEGLLLLTDDGELARVLMHPTSAVPKTYLAKVRGRPDDEALGRAERGIVLDGRRTLPAKLRRLRSGDNAWVEVTVTEGRKHQVRRLLEAVGHPVVKLRRVRYAGLELGDLPRGRLRPLTPAEVERLRRLAAGGMPRN